MSCKRLSGKARAEQDYWLSFSDTKTVSDAERLDFLHYDSHGGILENNPILLGKKRYGQYGEMMRDGYLDMKGGWPGGLCVVIDYVTREPFGVRPLIEWFGYGTVHRWLTEFLGYVIPMSRPRVHGHRN